jgi:CheY-like chemotaxis protein
MPKLSRRVLVIEDNPDARHSLRRLLELWNFDVEEAGDGPQGVQKALDGKPAAAIVDIGLPGFDGYEVARRIKTADSCILLIALTAYGSPKDRQQAFAAGFRYHLTKPADPADLRCLLEDAFPGPPSA